MKPHSEACDRNRDPILKVIKDWFIAPGEVLEIGSGTGQHAVYFAAQLPHLQWIASDRAENHEGIKAWMDEAQVPNLRGPLELDVSLEQWPVDRVDYVFSANTAHIMGWPEVEKMFAGIGRVLRPAGVFCLYGPFNRDGQFTSESNQAFDESLKARDPKMGIRDDRALIALAKEHSLTFVADHSMPARNRILVWKKERES
jgi:SAM-dependent methyltransferase